MSRTFLGAACCGVICLVPLTAQAPSRASQLATELEATVNRVKEIVNQPVTAVPAGPNDHPALFHPGWFHEGAVTPDFDHVDVRTTQECAMYAKWPYVTSDLNPGVMFPGGEVEFNAMTKFFYTDRALPKKKLTEQEMVELNALYRTLGKDLAQLKELQAKGAAPAGTLPEPAALGPLAPLVTAAPAPGASPGSAPDSAPGTPAGPDAPGPAPALLTPPILAGLAGVLVLLLLWVRARRNRP